MGNLAMEFKDNSDGVAAALDDLASRHEYSFDPALLQESIAIAEGRVSITPRVEHLQALLEWQGGSVSLKDKNVF